MRVRRSIARKSCDSRRGLGEARAPPLPVQRDPVIVVAAEIEPRSIFCGSARPRPIDGCEKDAAEFESRYLPSATQFGASTPCRCRHHVDGFAPNVINGIRLLFDRARHPCVGRRHVSDHRQPSNATCAPRQLTFEKTLSRRFPRRARHSYAHVTILRTTCRSAAFRSFPGVPRVIVKTLAGRSIRMRAACSPPPSPLRSPRPCGGIAEG